MQKVIVVLFLCGIPLLIFCQETENAQLINLDRSDSNFRTRDNTHWIIPQTKRKILLSVDTHLEPGDTDLYFRSSAQNKDTISAGYFENTGLYCFNLIILEGDDSTHFVNYHFINPEDSLRYIYYQLPNSGYSWKVGTGDRQITSFRKYVYCNSSLYRFSRSEPSSVLFTQYANTGLTPPLNRLLDSLGFIFKNCNRVALRRLLENLKQSYIDSTSERSHFQFTFYIDRQSGFRLFVSDMKADTLIDNQTLPAHCIKYISDVLALCADSTVSLILDSEGKPLPLISASTVAELQAIAAQLFLLDTSVLFSRVDAGNAEETLQVLSDGTYPLGNSGLEAAFVHRNESQQFVFSAKITGSKKSTK